jgi:signal transduction histidine kinase
MRWRIRSQLLLPPLTLLLGVVGISTWTALASANRARQQIETQMRDIAHTAGEVTLLRNLQTLKLMKGLSGAEYLWGDAHGRPLLDDADKPITTLTTPPGELPAATADWQDLRLGPRVRVGGVAYLCSGVHLGQKSGRDFTLFIFYPESLWRDALWEAVRPSLILGAFGGLASIVLAVGVGQRLSRRIQELERRTRLIAAGDFSPMPLPRRDDELRDLGRSVNDMAGRLAQLQETVQKTERLRLLGQVSGGLAHQLRNGVTGARLALQLHARECHSSVEREALDVALRQLALLEVHLKRFLDLGRTNELRRESCSLTRTLDETVALLRPQCQHARVELRWQAPAEILQVQGDADQLGHLFLNVLGNAIEAAGPGGWVGVAVKETTGDRKKSGEKDDRGSSTLCRCVVIEITDTGPGPPAGVAARLFEPFVTGKREGVGLGLAVARQIVEAHGGNITWGREAGRTCFRIELPLE